MYALLLRLYPASFRRRFDDQMKQTFNDLLQEHLLAERRLFGFVLRMFIETLGGAIGENMAIITSRRKALLPILLMTALFLLVPFIAMQFTDEVNWTLTDFVVAGLLFAGAGLLFVRLASTTANPSYRAAVAIAVLTALMLTWVNLAVGIIGDANNPANLMYIAVLLVGVTGSVIVRRRPGGMARILVAMALLQILIGVIAQVSGMDHMPVITIVFVSLWLTSAWLFRRSGTDPMTRM